MSASGRIPGLGFELPAGASATTARFLALRRERRALSSPQSWPDASNRGESELGFSQNVVEKESNIRERLAMAASARSPAVQELASGGEFAEWRACSSELFRRDNFRLLLGEHALRSLQRPLRARVPACRIHEGMRIA